MSHRIAGMPLVLKEEFTYGKTAHVCCGPADRAHLDAFLLVGIGWM